MNELIALLQAAGLNPPPGFAERLLQFERLLLETNQTLNLTAITEPEEMMKKHYWDSIYPLSLRLFPPNATLIDVGCGAGFPSVPLKLFFPALQVTMLDSLQKRLRFLESAVSALELRGIRTLHARAEDAGHAPDQRERYLVAVSRAVAELPKLCEYCLPLVRVGGVFLAYKGASAEAELEQAQNAIRLLGGRVKTVHQYTLPGEEDRRAIIAIEKIAPTPKAYPRGPKQIKERPL